MIEVDNRKTVHDYLSKYSPIHDKNSVIEVTEWTNGEGWDIHINDKPGISLHYGELEAINFLVKYLEYGDEKVSVQQEV